MTVTLALSELRSLITKAARGAGLSWGLSEEAGWAAEWLARRGMPAADWATIWLSARIDGRVSPIEIGAELSDELSGGRFVEGRALRDGLAAPGYLLPFLHRIADDQAPVAITSESGNVVLVSADGQVEFGPAWQRRSCGWAISRVAQEVIFRRSHPGRLPVTRTALERLEALALRTTVPRSDASRLGAGSATGDND